MIHVVRPAVLVAAGMLLANTAWADNFARQALPIWDKVAGSPASLRLVSPDGASHVIAHYVQSNGGEVSLTVAGRIGSGKVSLGPGVGSELLWAPDSRAFAVSTSDAGANGLYRAVIVAAGQHGLQVKDLSPLVRSAFGFPVRCGWAEYPNVGVIQWKDGSRRVIVAAEIVAHSNCDSFGTFRAYEVDWRSMRIISGFSQLDAKRLFKPSLGVELRNAPDECIRSPRTCWVSTNHPSTKRR